MASRTLDARLERKRAELALLEERAALRDSTEYQWLRSAARRLRKRHAAHELAEGVETLAGIVAEQERKALEQRQGITQHELTDAETSDAAG